MPERETDMSAVFYQDDPSEEKSSNPEQLNEQEIKNEGMPPRLPKQFDMKEVPPEKIESQDEGHIPVQYGGVVDFIELQEAETRRQIALNTTRGAAGYVGIAVGDLLLTGDHTMLYTAPALVAVPLYLVMRYYFKRRS